MKCMKLRALKKKLAKANFGPARTKLNRIVIKLCLTYNIFHGIISSESEGWKMSKKTKQKPKTWAEVFQAQRREFPQGYCVTRVIPDKRFKKPKYKKGWDE